LVAIGLFAASPFLCDRLVGTGEAYNYSLSVADAVLQMRGGIMPPLAGQTVYAFNGRIHPLRNAPYLYYMAAAVDKATRHKLTSWEIQNICLTTSLIGAGLACYIGLRRGLACPRLPAFLLSGAYALSPPLLGASYSFDLFMTVHAAVFVPLAVAACIRGVLRPSFNADAWLAAAVAGAWLTHPPVALWLTAGVVFVRLFAFCRQPRWVTLASGTCAVALAAGLAAFVFASVTALNPSTGALSSVDAGHGLPPLIMENLRGAFPACIYPVAHKASTLGSLQFGYVAWLLFGFAAVCVARARKARNASLNTEWLTALSALLFAGLLLVLTLPVPFLTFWLWRRLPGVVLELTTIWPMQRLYLVATAFTLFGAALVVPKEWKRSWRRPWQGAVAVLLAASWMLFQAKTYLGRGYHDRRPPNETADLYVPTNIDLTETSYAFFGVPPTYVVGVMDPQFEFRILKNGTQEIGSTLDSAVATGTPLQSLVLREDHPIYVTLVPGKRYVLNFAFRTPPVTGIVYITGTVVRRLYSLPSAGQAAGFGMNDGQRRSIPIWTDNKKPEQVGIRLDVPELNSPAGRRVNFADLTLVEVHPEKLPVRLESLSPLRFAVSAPQEGLTIETPRRFIPGYEAIVNGRKIRPVISPYREVMVPVPPGESTVELECKGPPYVVTAFWISAYCWLGFFAWQLTGSRVSERQLDYVARWPSRAGRFAWRHKFVALVVAAGAAAAFFGWRRHEREMATLRAVGPLSIDFMLPYGQTGLSQPLVSTGKPGAGAVVFVHFIDERHITIGADVWGGLYMSQPIDVDFSRVQNVVVSDSAFFPEANPAVKNLTPGEFAQVRGEVKVELNGVTVIQQKRYAFETEPSEIQLGHTQFVSATNPEFLGEILKVERLLVPRTLTMPGGRHARLVVEFPEGKTGTSEPLLSITRGKSVRECYATYLAPNRLRITCWSPTGSVIDSGEFTYDPKRSHTLDFAMGDTDDRSLELDVGCKFDDVRLLGRDRVHPAGEPAVITSANNSAHAPGVEAHFTGTRMDLSLIRDIPSTGQAETSGPVHMVVVFPSDKTARHEPLLTTGHAGAGDLVYVVYLDEGHIQIEYDHWGVGGSASGPIPIDYTEPHEIWITMGSLHPEENKGTSQLSTVLLDGRKVLTSAIAPYPTLPAEVTVAQNRIGASTADPNFSGAVQFVERTGSARTPGGRL
jgi:hypothetical protein